MALSCENGYGDVVDLGFEAMMGKPATARRQGSGPRSGGGSGGGSGGRSGRGSDRRTGADPARLAALTLLAGVRGGQTLADQIGMGALDRLDPGDRARAQRLALAVLRLTGRADAVLTPHLARRPAPAIMDILRLAVVEMLALDTPAHGAVNAAVAVARAGNGKQRAAAGMINAVLRKAAEGRAAWDAAGPQMLPEWLRGPLITAWGDSAVRAIEAVQEQAPPLDLTLRSPLETDLPEGMALPTGSLRLTGPVQVSALPGHAGGAWWVQDAAAALAVRALAPEPGEVIADLCAAPGGKTMQLAAAGAQVTAVDSSAPRLKRLAENLRRTGLDAKVICADVLDWRPDTPPDAVLLDAPCSATGTIRRHPDLPVVRDGSALPEITDLQARMIDHALAILRPGGRLVYATCSLLPAEGEDQIAAALTRHPGVTVEPAEVPGTRPEWLTGAGALRLRPDYWADLGGMDGFFIARLRKPAG
ncbi:RsmB/NOP family class I SAM-dependent RNA methyltransferase [Paracoccus pacificus]|uniref:RsmB/NOP family class I SAM-dependent RNA methyltransferase n=1 Tax=Paracoccus pacificus TaxID=1463598 RepID=A0ABW4R7K0_9RHOB